MTDLIKRKLENCQVKPIDTKPYSEELQALKEENARLKELLKECRKFILDLYGLPYGFNKDVSAKDILTKINEEQ